jgi:hypothetical protein
MSKFLRSNVGLDQSLNARLTQLVRATRQKTWRVKVRRALRFALTLGASKESFDNAFCGTSYWYNAKAQSSLESVQHRLAIT